MSMQQLSSLAKRLNSQQRMLNILDSYYDGSQAISFLHPDVRRLVGNRLTTLVINWPAHVLDSLEDRLDVQGFMLGGADDADKDLWTTWQTNGMDVDSQIAHLEALLYGRSAVSVWPEGNNGSDPIMAIETPKQVLVDYEPGTRKVRAAIKQWSDEKQVNATLFLPNTVEVYQGSSSSQVTNADGTMSAAAPYDISSVVKLVDILPNPLGVVPIVPMVNRRRTTLMDGQSELTPIIPLADAVNKLATDMMVTSEFYAQPRRWATGIQIPPSGGEGADTKARLQAEAQAQWDASAAGRTWLGGEGVSFGQFEEAQLSSFVSAIEMLTNFLGALGVLPPHYMGISTKNPASADAIRSAEASLTKRAERKQTPFGGTWTTAQCYAQAIKEGVAVADLDPKYLSMQTVWANPETQTITQLGDFAQKMVAAEIFAIPTAQEWVGMSPQQRERDNQFREAESPLQDLQTKLAFAKQLMTEEGIEQPAAFAAAGLSLAQGTAGLGPVIPAGPVVVPPAA